MPAISSPTSAKRSMRWPHGDESRDVELARLQQLRDQFGEILDLATLEQRSRDGRNGRRRGRIHDLAGLLQLGFEQHAPVRPGALDGSGRGDAGELAHSFRDTSPAGRGQQGRQPDERRGIPPFGLAQRRRQRPQNAARSLEPFELGPAAVE